MWVGVVVGTLPTHTGLGLWRGLCPLQPSPWKALVVVGFVIIVVKVVAAAFSTSRVIVSAGQTDLKVHKLLI